MRSTEGFSASQRHEIDAAVRSAEITSRFEFSVFVGNAGDDSQGVRAFAERLHANLTAPDRSLLVLLDPQRRELQIVTGAAVRRVLSDESARLAAVSMQAAFAEGDLVGGLKRGLSTLAEAARAPKTLHAD